MIACWYLVFVRFQLVIELGRCGFDVSKRDLQFLCRIDFQLDQRLRQDIT